MLYLFSWQDKLNKSLELNLSKERHEIRILFEISKKCDTFLADIKERCQNKKFRPCFSNNKKLDKLTYLVSIRFMQRFLKNKRFMLKNRPIVCKIFMLRGLQNNLQHPTIFLAFAQDIFQINLLKFYEITPNLKFKLNL
jgi:hypothetical protein